MFERYTEKARRTIFFARYEASQFGSSTIESEHMLLGLLREDKELTNRFLRSHESVKSIRKEIEGHTTIREKVSTSVDLPLSDECKRILGFSAEEAGRLRHEHIGTEHLMLGIMREENSLAAKLLRERGLQLDQTRAQMIAAHNEAMLKGGTGSDPGFQRQNMVEINFVEEGSSTILLSYSGTSLIPRIGEAILIRKDESPGRSYRIRDVVWDFNWYVGGSFLPVVIVRVVEENTVHTESQETL